MTSRSASKASSRARALVIAAVGCSLVVVVVLLGFDGMGSGTPEPAAPDARAVLEEEPGTRDDAPRTRPPGPERASAGQRAFDELVEVGSRDASELAARLRHFVTGSDAEQRAALRYLREVGVLDPVPILAALVLRPETAAEVRSQALEALEPHARVDRRARRGLIGFLGTGPENAGDRSRAFDTLGRFGDPADWDACMPLLIGESEPDVVCSAARSLAQNPDPALRAKVESLHWRHADPVVRQRLRALGLGR